ncbi:MAG: lysozyme inhibitor LprI family protein [Pseudomonadota bacterium]
MSRLPSGSEDKPVRRTWVWWVFFMPGAAFMWLEYMFPSRGDVLASKRRYGSKPIQFWYSLGIYGVLIVSLLMWAVSHRSAQGRGVQILPTPKPAIHLESGTEPESTPVSTTQTQRPTQVPQTDRQPSLPTSQLAKAEDAKQLVAMDGPSFDCHQASTETEKAICADPQLAALDRRMAEAFSAVVMARADKDALRKQQNTWRRMTRDTCMDNECLSAAYQQRIAELKP